MRMLDNFVLVEKLNEAAVGRFEVSKIPHGKVIKSPSKYNDLNYNLDDNEIILLQRPWLEYTEVEEGKLYIVPITDVMMAFDEDEIFLKKGLHD